MYTNFFGFNLKPFELTPDSNFLYLSHDLREILATLKYGISQRRGFVLLVGEPGTGKTTLINSLIDKEGEDTNFAYIFNPDLNFNDLLHTVLMEFDLASIDEHLSKNEAKHRLKTFVIDQFEKDKNTVIIVDEAQGLDVKALENLRLLSNIETRKQKLIQIIISGQPELENTLSQKSLTQLAQRIGLRCRTKPLTEKEAYEYMDHRLKVANYNGPELFANKAKQDIWRYSQGLPRTINIICDNALLTGYASNIKRIDSSIIRQVMDDINKVPLNMLDNSPNKSENSNEGRDYAEVHNSDLIPKVAEKNSKKPEINEEDGAGIINKIRGKLIHSHELEGVEKKERPSNGAWIAGIGGVVIIVNIFILYLFFGSFKDFKKDLSSKLEAMQENARYLSTSMKDSMNTAATSTHQEIGKNIENEINSKHSGISSNSNDKFSIDTSSSGGSSDVENVLKNNSVVVRKGDTLNKIIIRIYGKEELEILDAILRVNPEISNPNIIFENQIIKLPEKFNRG